MICLSCPFSPAQSAPKGNPRSVGPASTTYPSPDRFPEHDTKPNLSVPERIRSSVNLYLYQWAKLLHPRASSLSLFLCILSQTKRDGVPGCRFHRSFLFGRTGRGDIFGASVFPLTHFAIMRTHKSEIRTCQGQLEHGGGRPGSRQLRMGSAKERTPLGLISARRCRIRLPRR